MNATQITFSQYLLYLQAMGEDQRRDLKERAIAARVANATQDGWNDFMQLLDSGKAAPSNADAIEAVCAKKPPETTNDDEAIEWQKLN